jgi:uncharacterized membrane protein
MIEVAITILIGAVISLAGFVWLAHRDMGRAIAEMRADRVTMDRAVTACERAADGATRAAIRDWVGQRPKDTPAE